MTVTVMFQFQAFTIHPLLCAFGHHSATARPSDFQTFSGGGAARHSGVAAAGFASDILSG